MDKPKDCKFCNKQGLRFLPLVYAVVTGTNKDALAELPEIQSKKLGSGVTDLALSDQAKYAVRLTPPGYLYNLIERKGAKHWQSYLVQENAFVYQLTDDEPLEAVRQFSCNPENCGIDASMISIPRAGEVKNAWLMYSPSALTAAKLEEYKKNAETYASQGKMQHFSPAAWLAKNTEQKHTLLAAEVLKTVAEYVLFTQEAQALSTPLGKLLEQQMIPAIQDAFAGGIPPNAEGHYGGRLGKLYNTMKRDGYGAVVAHNPIVITQTLNDFRNAPLESLQGYLAATDRFGFSNQRRMEIFEAIEEIRAGFEQGIVHDAKTRIEQLRKQHDAIVEGWEHNFRTRGAMMMADERKIKADLERDRQLQEARFKRELEEAQAEAPEKWRKKYASRLSTYEMETFNNELNEITQEAFALAEKRVPDHLKWFESDRLVQAFDMYDPKDIKSGYSFALQSAICTIGMAGCESNQDKLDEWIKAPSIERKNIYMRGFMFGQDDLIVSAKQAFAEIRATAAKVDAASEIEAKDMLKMTKGLVSSFKAVDSAFDEWVRNQGQSEFTRNWVKSSKTGGTVKGLEAVLYHKTSEITRTIFRTGVGGRFDKGLTACIGGLLYSRLGKTAEKLAFNELMLEVPEHKLAAKPNERERTTNRRREIVGDRVREKAAKIAGQVDDSLDKLVADARAKVDAKVKPTLAEYLENSGNPDKLHTNNYHQVRIGVLLGCIEMIALGEKLNRHGLSGWDTKAKLEIWGSIFAVGSIVADTLYSAAKSIREIKPYATSPKLASINLSADIWRGGLKLGAGALASLAGGCIATLDLMKFLEEKNTTLKWIYGFRFIAGGGSALLAPVVAFSYAAPLLRHGAEKYAARRAFFTKTAQGAAWFAARRVYMLVWVARLNLVGLALTAIEIGYLYFKDDDLQNWCEKSTFRKEKTHTTWLGKWKVNEYYADVNKELEELYKAAQAVGIRQ